MLLHCQAGCPPEDVLAALELTYPMLHDDYEDPDVFAARRAREREDERRSGRRSSSSTRPRRRPAPKPRPALPKGRLPKRLTRSEPRPLGEWSVTTTYDYCDAGGVVIHQEVRHQRQVEVVDVETGATAEGTEKRFTQRWPDDQGGWVEKTPGGFMPVLYRLPDLAEWISEGRRIWLTEGVKDAERFLELGEAATTNPSGAGNFKPEQAASLGGAHVVAVLDHDLAGYRRGLKLGELLTEVASLRFVLPITRGRHEDASDHFDAGHGLADFVEVTREQLALLEQVADAEEAALLAGEAAAEATVRAQRAQAAPSKTRREPEERYAARWAAEAGKQLVRAATALETAVQAGQMDPEPQRRLNAAVEACQAATSASHQAADVEIPEQLESFLQEPSFPAAAAGVDEGGRTTAELEEELGELIEHPTADRLPEPRHRIPSPRRVSFAYEEGGEGRRPRGIYMGNEGRWERVSPLPYVRARIIRRDGSGRQTGTFYLVSLEDDGQTVLVGPEDLRSNSWTNTLDLSISQHAEILTAASSALVLHGHDAPALEATPRMSEEGRVDLPHPDTMPPGYLMTSGLDREEALDVWRQILSLAAENPRFALVLGAAAIAPFIGGLKQQPHVVAMYGEARKGKSTTLQAAGSMWGYPGGETDSGVCLSWNATTLSVPAFLGDLGVLPAFMDEI
ncbi:DUF927 domain-containing protein, partial [Nocardioides sp.]|uniref:DUF927 domain-containing protein n=1 Tax=Nocardioides sp. TaxID=35761 RepID=UPI002732D216